MDFLETCTVVSADPDLPVAIIKVLQEVPGIAYSCISLTPFVCYRQIIFLRITYILVLERALNSYKYRLSAILVISKLFFNITLYQTNHLNETELHVLIPT